MYRMRIANALRPGLALYIIIVTLLETESITLK